MVDRRQAYNTERHEASSVAETGSYDRGSAIDFEQLGKGTKEPLGMAKRKMKDHADRQRCLDRNVRIGALATGLAGDRSTPGIERSIAQATASTPRTIDDAFNVLLYRLNVSAASDFRRTARRLTADGYSEADSVAADWWAYAV